jgi:hypothetical protein
MGWTIVSNNSKNKSREKPPKEKKAVPVVA